MKIISRKRELFVGTVTLKKKEKTMILTPQSKVNNQKTITLTLTIAIAIEHFWLNLFSGKTFVKLKILSQMPDRDIYVFTKSLID